MNPLRLPPPKRGPRFRDLIYIGGTAMPIEALPLCQPKAPASYIVESPMGTEREVRWDGLRWSDERNNSRNILDEGHGDQEKTSALPQAGSMPASSSDLRPPKRRAKRKAKADAALSPFIAQQRGGAAEAVAASQRTKYPATHRKDVELPPEIQGLHAALDRARDRKHLDEEAYYAAIEAVDQADPGFYLGRHNPLAPLPRYVPPIDLAAISAGLGARLELEPEPVEETS